MQCQYSMFVVTVLLSLRCTPGQIARGCTHTHYFVRVVMFPIITCKQLLRFIPIYVLHWLLYQNNTVLIENLLSLCVVHMPKCQELHLVGYVGEWLLRSFLFKFFVAVCLSSQIIICFVLRVGGDIHCTPFPPAPTRKCLVLCICS